jgi:hypothetical protein
LTALDKPIRTVKIRLRNPRLTRHAVAFEGKRHAAQQDNDQNRKPKTKGVI